MGQAAATRGSSRLIERKLRTLDQYRFAFAFENTATAGYVTEKVFNAIEAGAVPLYWGAPDVADSLATPSAIVHAARDTISTPAALAAEIARLESSVPLFLSKYAGWHLERWESDSVHASPTTRECRDSVACRLCHSLARGRV